MTSSTRHAFPSLFPLTSAVFSSAAGGCQPGMEQMVEPSGRWEHGKSHWQAGVGRLGQARCSLQDTGLSTALVVTGIRNSSAGHLQPGSFPVGIQWEQLPLAPGAAAVDAMGQEQSPPQPAWPWLSLAGAALAARQ